MDIIRRKNIYLTFSALLIGLSVAAIAVFGLPLGIDFTGGTLWQVNLQPEGLSPVSAESARAALLKILPSPFVLSEQSSGALLIRTEAISEADHQAYLGSLRSEFPGVNELGFETIGPTIGRELRDGAVTVFALVLIAISLYISFSFRRVSRPVSSWRYGLVTLITLFHDAIIAIGFFALLGRFTGAEVDISFVVAILVVVGFSVHDTIVVFDRIRENLRGGKGGEVFGALVNRSVNETFARSVNTSLTLVLALIALYFFGAESLASFVLTILVGTVVGTYSSIFVASPLLVVANRKK